MDESLAPLPRFRLDNAPTEITALVEFLDIHRIEFHEKIWGVTEEQLHQTAASSDLTLGGLLKHMAFVEHTWFEYRFLGQEACEPWASADWDADADWELNSAAADSAEELFRVYVDTVARCRDIIANAETLGQLSVRGDQHDKPWNMRWIMVHMIEEYARHLGHADLIRESIDGVTG